MYIFWKDKTDGSTEEWNKQEGGHRYQLPNTHNAAWLASPDSFTIIHTLNHATKTSHTLVSQVNNSQVGMTWMSHRMDRWIPLYISLWPEIPHQSVRTEKAFWVKCFQESRKEKKSCSEPAVFLSFEFKLVYRLMHAVQCQILSTGVRGHFSPDSWFRSLCESYVISLFLFCTAQHWGK